MDNTCVIPRVAIGRVSVYGCTSMVSVVAIAGVMSRPQNLYTVWQNAAWYSTARANSFTVQNSTLPAPSLAYIPIATCDSAWTMLGEPKLLSGRKGAGSNTYQTTLLRALLLATTGIG